MYLLIRLIVHHFTRRTFQGMKGVHFLSTNNNLIKREDFLIMKSKVFQN